MKLYRRQIRAQSIVGSVLLLLLIASCGGDNETKKNDDPTELNLVSDLTNKMIRPNYQLLTDSSTAFQASVTTFCGSPSENGLMNMRDEWKRLMLRWQSASVIRMEPLEANDLGVKIASWPLGESILESRVDALLTGDETPNEDLIKSGSVILQGLPALEYLLFGGAVDISLTDFIGVNGVRRCEVISVVTNVVNENINTVNNLWLGGFGDDVANPESNDGGFASSNLALDDLVNNLNTALEVILNDKLGFVLGGKFGDQNGELFESSRSGHSLENIVENVRTIREAFLLSDGVGVSLVLQDKGFEQLNQQIVDELERLLLLLSEVQTPIVQSVNTVENYNKLVEVNQSVLALHRLFEEQLFNALDVTIDFNSQDGD